jgi:hypothetical protein
MTLRRIAGPLATALWLAAGATRAQTTGSLSGELLDASTLAPVADAVVVASSPALQGEQLAISDATGAFGIALLPAGPYTLTVQRAGYQAFTQTGLVVHLDQALRVRLLLLPEKLQGEAIEVLVSRPVLATGSVQSGGTITKEQMQLVPYGREARNFDAVATAIPRVHRDFYGLQVGGAGSPESSYLIDGVMVNDPAYGTLGTRLLQDFVEEVDVKTGGYQAEHGRSSGGLLNVVTKSGGNEFHGSLFGNWSPFEAARNAIASNYAIAQQQAQAYNLDFGAELGGPIFKDRLWFFAGFAPQLVATHNYRIIQARKDDGSGSPVINPATGNPLMQELARQDYQQTQTNYQYTGKLTLLLNQDHTLSLAVYGNPGKVSGLAVVTVSSAQLIGNEGTFLADQSQGALDGTLRYQGKLFDRTTLIEASLGVHRQDGAQSRPSTTAAAVGSLSAAQAANSPQVQWTGPDNLLNPLFDDGAVPASQRSQAVLAGCAIHSDGFNPCPTLGYNTGGFGFTESSTLTRFTQELKVTRFFEWLGHHTAKAGASLQEDQFAVNKTYSGGLLFVATPGAAPGTYQYNGNGFGHVGQGGLPAFDPSSTQPNTFADSVLHKTTHNLGGALFLQDSWSIVDKVVLDAGVRVEYQRATPYVPPSLAAQSADLSFSLTNVMPRLGLIYDWTGRGLGRAYASFGRYYEYVPLDMVDRDLSAEQALSVNTRSTGCSNAKDPRTCPLVGPYGFFGSTTALDPNLQGQYVDEYQAGVDYQLYRDITVGVGYVHKRLGRVIEDLSTNNGGTIVVTNPGVPGSLGAGGVTPAGLLFAEPTPERTYDAVTLSLGKQLSDNYLLQASYTWSALRGNYPGLFTNEYQKQLDPNMTSEYDLVPLLANRHGPLPGDVPNAFKLSAAYVYEWDARTTINLGTTFDLHQGTPTNYLGAYNAFYNQSAIFLLPRGSGPRLPWQHQLDARLSLSRRLGRDYSLLVSADLFNLTNAQAVADVDQNYTLQAASPVVNGTPADLAWLRQTSGAPITRNANFGQPIQYQLPFSMRLGVKLSF